MYACSLHDPGRPSPPSGHSSPQRQVGSILPYCPSTNTILCVGTPAVVACITDFGSADYYAGALRGTLAKCLPGRPIVDVSHDIPPGDIRRAAILLWEVQPAFPQRTVFLVVVDPGVGGHRAAAAFSFPACTVVCPDNGVATFLMNRYPAFSAVALDPRRIAKEPISNTFHGRDLFAPAAARLAQGTDPLRLGTALPSPARTPLPFLQGDSENGWEGEVLYVDRFGNAVTSIGRISFDLQELIPWLPSGARGGRIPPRAQAVLEDGSFVRLGRTYAEAAETSERIALVGSNGLLEIASWRPGAVEVLPLRIGSRVRLETPA